ncbi:MAG: hypothetical protein ABI426_06740 [Flavobacterium sp.]
MFLRNPKYSLKFILFSVLITSSLNIYSQDSTRVSRPAPLKTDFWERVHFGAGLGLSAGGGFTNITLAPSAIYDLNDYVSLGLGVQGTYIKQKGFYSSYLYGVNEIVLFNPLEQLQISAELEELRVNNTYEATPNSFKEDFWNTALFIGAGFRNNNLTIGLRYNVLYKESDNVYSQAWMPFVRVYF